MRLYGLLGGQVHICVQSMWQTSSILILDLFNLVEAGTVFAQT